MKINYLQLAINSANVRGLVIMRANYSGPGGFLFSCFPFSSFLPHREHDNDDDDSCVKMCSGEKTTTSVELRIKQTTHMNTRLFWKSD